MGLDISLSIFSFLRVVLRTAWWHSTLSPSYTFWDRLSLCCPGWTCDLPSAPASKAAEIQSVLLGQPMFLVSLWLTVASSTHASNSSGSESWAHLPESHLEVYVVTSAVAASPWALLSTSVWTLAVLAGEILVSWDDVSCEQRRHLRLKLLSTASTLNFPHVPFHQSVLCSLERCTIACLYSKQNKYANEVPQGLGGHFPTSVKPHLQNSLKIEHSL